MNKLLSSTGSVYECNLVYGPRFEPDRTIGPGRVGSPVRETANGLLCQHPDAI